MRNIKYVLWFELCFSIFKNKEPLYIILCITGNLVECVGFSLSSVWCLSNVMYFNQLCLWLLFWKTERELGTQFPSTVDQNARWNVVDINSSYLGVDTHTHTHSVYDSYTFFFAFILLV
jgi:hypothetical protein